MESKCLNILDSTSSTSLLHNEHHQFIITGKRPKKLQTTGIAGRGKDHEHIRGKPKGPTQVLRGPFYIPGQRGKRKALARVLQGLSPDDQAKCSLQASAAGEETINKQRQTKGPYSSSARPSYFQKKKTLAASAGQGLIALAAPPLAACPTTAHIPGLNKQRQTKGPTTQVL